MTIRSKSFSRQLDVAGGLAGRVAYGALFSLALPAAMIATLRRLDHFMPVGLPMPPRAWGAASLLAGLALMVWSMRTMIRHGRGLPMNAYPTQAWVTTGPYRIFLHPIYFAFVAMVAGAAIGTQSVAGLYVGAPFAALSAAALVLGYEGQATRKRLGARLDRPWLALPQSGSRPPTASERLGAVVLAFGIWLGAFLSLAQLPVQPGAFTTWTQFDAAMPFSTSAMLFYLMTHWWAPAPAFVVSDVAELRRFCIVALAGTAIGCSIYLLCPFQTPPRGIPGPGALADLLSFERAHASEATAMPSFHVFWSVVSAAFLLRVPRSRALKAAIVAFAASQIVSCHVVGMHSLLDIAAGLVLAATALNIGHIGTAALRFAETVANDWRPIRIGPVLRVFPHGAYVFMAGMIGLTIAMAFAPGDGSRLLVLPMAGLVGAGVWGNAVEGTYFSRPFGFFGGLFGALAAAVALSLLGQIGVQTIAALAIGLPFGQAIGRLRCLAQGCCHGAAYSHGGSGLRYENPLSRVAQIESLAGKVLKPAPVASIGFNLLIGAALARMATDGLDAVVIVSAYLVLTGLGRFVEEGMRGEPQTPIWRGLSLYQWLCVALVGSGMAVVFLANAGALPSPAWPDARGVVMAAVVSLFWTVGLSVDWPWTGWRFSRLAPI